MQGVLKNLFLRGLSFGMPFVRSLPLGLRKQLAILTDRQKWIPNCHVLSMAMIRDWAAKDVDAFHRFLWAHHLGYAKFYEAVHDFGA